KINNAKLWGVIARPLAAMQGRERETLRAAYHLYNIGAIGSYSFYVSRAALIYGDGKAQIPNGMSWDGIWQGPNMQVTDPTEAMKKFTGRTAESAISSVLHWLETSAGTLPDDPTIKMLKEKLLGGGTTSLTSTAAFAAAQSPDQPGLILGISEEN